MKHRSKQLLSILLSLALVLGLLPGMPLTASAAVGDVLAEDDYLTFTAEEAGSTVTLNVLSGSNFQYDLNGTGLTDYTAGTQITLANASDYVRFSGTGTKFNSSNHVVITGKVACSGNVMSLRLNGGKVQSLEDYCFDSMFYGCTGLTSAPELPETELKNYCYRNMFYRCENLTKAPELPATNLANGCYSNMFYYCKSLTKAPELPATNLADFCYYYMFYGCTSLTEAPELPATNLADSCYYGMFSGCTSLTKAPALPATNLAGSCYSNMFYGCKSLTELPALPATTLERTCYKYMFSGCSKICISDQAGTFGDITYSAEYRIPTTGEGTSAYDALTNMFGNTGGKFKGTPDINTTYYVPAPATYTVTWKNGETVLETDTGVAAGAAPSYDGETPTKAEDNYYTYTFSGWNDGETTYAPNELPAVSGDVTYTAQYTATAKTFKAYAKKLTGETYTIENLTGETTVAQLKEIIAGQIDIPATAQSLIFAGKQLEDAKTLAEYNIKEGSTIFLIIRGYTVTWLNYDNSELGTTTVQYGATPSYDGDTPEKAEDENYTYTFYGWSDGSNTYAADALPAVSGDVTYTAVFTADPKTPQLPDVIKDCTYYDSYHGVYANVPFAEEFNDIQNGAIIFDSYSDTEKSIMDTKDYSYKFYDENGTELQAENVYSDDTADGYGFRVIMNVYEFSNPVSGPLYIVATAPTPVGESTFYLVGSFNSWQADEAYALTKNAEAEGEYMLFGVELHKDDALKVLETNSSIPNFEPVWYPGGYNNDYVVPADGIYDIYFRPNYDGGEDWFYSCIYLADVTPELPAFTGKSLSLNGSIGVNFFFTVPDGYDMTGVSFDLAWGEAPHAHTLTVAFSENLWDANSGMYRVTANVAAAEMTDTVTVTMKQGEEVLADDTGSVLTYAQGILNGEKDEYLLDHGFNQERLAELKDLCQAMLVYGAKSQLQFNYKTENLAADEAMIAELEPLDADEIEALGTMSFPEDFTENCGISYYGCSLLLRSTTTLRLYFTVADQDKLNALTVSLEGETLTCGVNGRLVYFDVADIPAALVFTNRTLNFGDEAVTVNVGAYVRSVLNGSNETLKAAMTALYRYSEAAQAYFVN